MRTQHNSDTKSILQCITLLALIRLLCLFAHIAFSNGGRKHVAVRILARFRTRTRTRMCLRVVTRAQQRHTLLLLLFVELSPSVARRVRAMWNAFVYNLLGIFTTCTLVTRRCTLPRRPVSQRAVVVFSPAVCIGRLTMIISLTIIGSVSTRSRSIIRCSTLVDVARYRCTDHVSLRVVGASPDDHRSAVRRTSTNDSISSNVGPSRLLELDWKVKVGLRGAAHSLIHGARAEAAHETIHAVAHGTNR